MNKYFLFSKRTSELKEFENFTELKEFINRNLEENQFEAEDFEQENIVIIEGKKLLTKVTVQFEVRIQDKNISSSLPELAEGKKD